MGANCTLAGITVTAATAGPHVNVSGNILSTQTGTNYGTGGTATDTLTAILPPTIDKTFTPASIPVEGTSTLTFVTTNPNTERPLTAWPSPTCCR